MVTPATLFSDADSNSEKLVGGYEASIQIGNRKPKIKEIARRSEASAKEFGHWPQKSVGGFDQKLGTTNQGFLTQNDDPMTTHHAPKIPRRRTKNEGFRPRFLPKICAGDPTSKIHLRRLKIAYPRLNPKIPPQRSPPRDFGRMSKAEDS